MHQKKVKKYYRIRADYLLGIIICVIAITAAFIHLAFNHRQTKETSIPEKQIKQTDVTFDNLHSVLKNKEGCYLCGNAEESLMEYYRKFDTIGIISLNDWYVIDFPLKNYDENGNEIKKNTSTSFLSGNTDAIPLCIVDFKTLEVYSLQKQWKSYFVRDYYIEIDSEENSVKVETFYLPELSD